MYGDMFRNIINRFNILINILIVIFIIFVPLGILKLIDIVVYFIRGVNV